MSIIPAAGPPRPAAVTITIDLTGGVVEIDVTVAPSLPDDGGIWSLMYDDGTGPVVLDTVGADQGVIDFPPAFDELLIYVGSFWVVQTGGGVQFSGDSPPSNTVTNP